jgi:hypothetical protein
VRRVLGCALAVAATVTPSTHHVEGERVTLEFAQAEGATKGPEGDWGLGAQLTALEAVVQRAATPDPAATVSRSSLQESTLREPLDDDPQRTPASLASDHLALVVEGATAMETILGNEELEQRFLKLANVCKAVVACRVSPAQKRLIVGLVRRKDTTRPVTLAIGDGANDVGMIQEAHIGVGISGKEGRQAVNNSDFAIGQFRFLKPLLLKHGRRNYRRMSKVIVYSFFKNIVLTFVLFYYQADCGWSGTSFYEAWVYSGFNFFLAFTPLAFGWFDVDTSAETVRKYPRLYAAGLHRMDLNVRLGVSFVPPSRRRRRRECFSLRLLPSSHWRAVGVTLASMAYTTLRHQSDDVAPVRHRRDAMRRISARTDRENASNLHTAPPPRLTRPPRRSRTWPTRPSKR